MVLGFICIHSKKEYNKYLNRFIRLMGINSENKINVNLFKDFNSFRTIFLENIILEKRNSYIILFI